MENENTSETPEATEIVETPGEEAQAIVEGEESVEAPAEETPETEEAGSQEVEVVYDGPEEPQAKKPENRRIRKRLKKQQVQIDAKDQEILARDAKIANLEQQNQILNLARGLPQETPVQNIPPDPNDTDAFPDGIYDVEYNKQVQAYRDRGTIDLVNKTWNENLNRADQGHRQLSVERKYQETQDAYDDKVANSNIKNYDEAEDAVITELGQNTFDTLLKSIDDPQFVIAFLGNKKNRARLERCGNAMKVDPLKGFADIIALSAKMKPTKLNKTLLDPDTEIPGGTPSARADDLKEKKLLDEADKTGNADKYLDYMESKRKPVVYSG